MQFQELKLIDPLLRAIQAEGYTEPTPIQQQAIPHVLAGRDLVGCAQTGTGKTAAFALPILQNLNAKSRQNGRDNNRHRRTIRALVVSPTRELASQIGDSFATYGRHTNLKHTVVFGGVGQSPQVQAVKRGVDVLVATPGRLLDLMNQGVIRLDKIEVFVLDEADRMLDMGFIHDVRRIVRALPTQRQTLLFSATMPPDIQDLANNILIDPIRVEVTPQATTVETIKQSVFFVAKKDKRALLEHLLDDQAIRRVLVFTRTKHGANKLARQLDRAHIRTEAIHGNKSQTARERALENFKTGKIRVLVATDIAARGIDVEDVTHVINFDLPNIPESYVHRIGRTARAGASGIAFSFCDVDERPYLRDIEKLIRLQVAVVSGHPYAAPENMSSTNGQIGQSNPASSQPSKNRNRRRSRPQNGNGRQPGSNNNRREGQPRRGKEQSRRYNSDG
jgi:ATP-dependent RNA helicase RhlE